MAVGSTIQRNTFVLMLHFSEGGMVWLEWDASVCPILRSRSSGSVGRQANRLATLVVRWASTPLRYLGSSSPRAGLFPQSVDVRRWCCSSASERRFLGALLLSARSA